MNLDFTVVPPYAGALAIGALWTILITILAGAISLIFGIGIALAQIYAPRWVRRVIAVPVFVITGTPLLLQLFLVYYGLSQIGILLPAFWTGVVGLGLHYAVYNADILRASILSIEDGQLEAGRALGFGRVATLRHFVLPQAIYRALPQIGNNIIVLLKDSVLLSAIGIMELVLSAQLAISRSFRPFEFYFTVAAIFYAINLVLEWGLGRITRRTEAMR